MATSNKVSLTKEAIIQEANMEVTKELAEKYKMKYKSKLKELEAAKRVVSNIEREIQDLELKMDQELGG